jgi:hypothetical protein
MSGIRILLPLRAALKLLPCLRCGRLIRTTRAIRLCKLCHVWLRTEGSGGLDDHPAPVRAPGWDA